jgi:hypothetical protein
MARKPAPKPMPADAAWAEFQALCREVGGEEISAAVRDRAGLIGLATLVYRSKRGCPVSSKHLMDHWLGLPVQPFEARVGQMDEHEAEAGMAQVLAAVRIDGKPLDPSFIGKLVEALCATAASAAEEDTDE